MVPENATRDLPARGFAFGEILAQSLRVLDLFPRPYALLSRVKQT